MTSTAADLRTAAAKLEEQLRNLPKVSLHDHLDGSLRPATLIELAAEIGHDLPSQDAEELAERFRQNANSGSLEKYLEAFAHTTAVMQTAPNLRRVAKEYVEDLAADGIIYSEVRWAPEQHQTQGLSLDEAVEAVQEGLNQGMETVAEQDGVIVVGQLVSAMRQSDRADEIVEVALRHRDKGVVGFDIAGPEAGFPPSRFADAFTRLATEMLPTTVHAGEGDGIESVRDALVSGRAQRLGHGVRVAEDISVIETQPDSEDDLEAGEEVFQVELGPVARWVRDRQIHLEVSPTSNLQTGAIAGFAQGESPELSDHPFDMLYQLGFNVGVNTDNRLVSGVTLSGELALIASTFDYGLGELADFQINALESSFLGHEEREALAGMILEAWQ
ncbi:adenosine deaminase [Nesterenkonia sp. AN1]|uniref:adenosine deaminase n=1 Tax=Nesterenkonia aurantiaca TaxID=1436010 RepID=A0A4R7G4W6_9MICC|nr:MULTISPECIES: adenosine deaminase [Nesterenkonia]EXF24335.1 adenosine deaminase [Nesterenkonia sp. AN1]TDS86427.1 adenosine deaminase [Nesterenkonia aurantiaca]